MMQESYTIEEVSHLLKVSKLTVYDLIKKEELPAYRVGRQMRVDNKDLENYKTGSKTGTIKQEQPMVNHDKSPKIKKGTQDIVISGQDMVLDILGKQIETHHGFTPLRSYTGSLNSLIAMYNEECDIVSTHLFDAETGTYNLPYIKRILVSHSFVVINLVCRNAGIYVKKGNPHQIQSWKDFAKPGLILANREVGSGARILLDEQLKLNNIAKSQLKGYNNVLTSHLSVATSISSGQADIGVGIENAAKMVDLDFIPLIKEQYDLVILKNDKTEKLIGTIKNITQSSAYLTQLKQLKGYDLSLTGTILYEC